MHPDAALVLKKLGGQPANFAARRLTLRIASDADLVLAMTKTHRDTVLELAPRMLHSTFLLTEAHWLASEYEPQSLADLSALRPYLSSARVGDIPDPIGQSAEAFSAVGAQIADLLPPILEVCRRSSAAEAD